MVNTKKFSQFAAANLTTTTKKMAGISNISGGENIIVDFTVEWTTAGRPSPPYDGLLGYNTDLKQYEYYDGTTAAWVQLADNAVFVNAKFIVQQPNASLPAAQALSALSTGILKSTTTTGVLSISAPLTSIDGLTTSSDLMLYTTASNVYSTTVLTAFARTLLDDTSAAAMRTTLGLGQAAVKNVTDNTKSNVASVTGSFVVGHVLLAADTSGTVVDGGSPAGMGTVLEVDTGTGLTGGPITTTGTISFAAIAAQSLWFNGTAGSAVPAVTTLDNLVLQITGPIAQPTFIQDTSANPVLAFGYAGGSPTDYLGIGNGTANAAILRVLSSNTNASFSIFSKGSGSVFIGSESTTTAPLVLEGNSHTFTVSIPTWTGNHTLTLPDADVSLVGAALTKTDDTNVTLTLGGSPTTALLAATSLTLGWTGQLSLARGGTNANLTAANGAIPYSTASAFALLAPGTSGQFLQSGGAGAPSWSTATFPSTGGAAGNILISNGTNYIASTSLWPNTVGSAGTILRSNGTSNAYSTATFADTYAVSTLLYASSSNAVSGLATANSAALVTNGSGVPAWQTMSAGQVLIGTTSGAPAAAAINSGTGITVQNASGSITVALSGTGPGTFTWNDVSGTSQAAAVNNGYIISNSSLTTVTLPATAAVGSVFGIAGKGAGGWVLQMNTGQTCHLNSTATTSAGSIASTNQWNSVQIVCVTANTTFTVMNSSGSLTLA